jgi:hypothetical protein
MNVTASSNELFRDGRMHFVCRYAERPMAPNVSVERFVGNKDTYEAFLWAMKGR